MLQIPGHSQAPHVRLLLAALADPAGCVALGLDSWDLLVRTARSSKLLGSLAARIDAAGIRDRIAEPAARHLDAAMAEAKYLRQMSLREMAVIADIVRPLSARMVALKGSAYILADLPIAAGRFPRDVDLMVERHRLDEVEHALRTTGWEFSKTDEYDQRYYREWSHELPPMRAAAMPLELDLHHTILPPIGRLRPDAARLIADSVQVPGSDFRVLRPADQFLHAAAHLFQDSDCAGKLRDLIDMDGLARDFSARLGEGFWRTLVESARLHGLGRPLWYSLTFCRAWLRTPVPDGAWSAIEQFRPPAAAGWAVVTLASRLLGPVHPDQEPGRVDRAASAALEFRALWLRMPPSTLAYHAANKLARGMRRSRPSSGAHAATET